MKFMGSKNRLAKYIAPIIQKYIDDNNIGEYYEPFVGGANMIDKIKCNCKYGSDNSKYLIALLNLKDKSKLPTTITKEEYCNVRDNKDNYPDWYVGLVGYCASYNAKFFGGYANGVKTKIGTIRNYTDEAIRNLYNQMDNLQDIEFKCCDFKDVKPHNAVIYADIPYRGTTLYDTSKNFPYEDFYQWCRETSKDNIVIISEYNMPDNFKCIWEKSTTTTMNNNRTKTNSGRVEKLWIYKGENND